MVAIGYLCLGFFCGVLFMLVLDILRGKLEERIINMQRLEDDLNNSDCILVNGKVCYRHKGV